MDVNIIVNVNLDKLLLKTDNDIGIISSSFMVHTYLFPYTVLIFIYMSLAIYPSYVIFAVYP
jgi:hypothetical protein